MLFFEDCFSNLLDISILNFPCKIHVDYHLITHKYWLGSQRSIVHLLYN
jgi:hypothetical protein